MQNPPFPLDEQERLARLRELVVLDSAPESLFDAITQMASQICGTPIALISLVDGGRQWFKANVGLPGVNETPRDVAFCAHAILDDALFEVPDATQDPRFADNPLVTGEPDIRFYAGAPLVLPGGERVGTLCVIDRTARQLDAKQAAMLRSLADVATHALVLRRELIDKTLSVRSEYETALAATSAELADLFTHAPCGYHSLDAEGRFVRVNDTALGWLGCTEDEVIGKLRPTDFLTAEGKAAFHEMFPRLMAEGHVRDIEYDLVGRNGRLRRVVASASVVRDAEGRFVRTRSITYDITELQQAREEMRRLSAEQKTVLDTDLVGILKLKDRYVTWANIGAEHLLGYGPGELTGRSTRPLYFDDATYQAVGVQAYAQLRVGALFRTQLQMKRKDGSALWIDMSATALPNEPLDALCMLVDITPLKQAEAVRMRAQSLEAENRQLAEAHRVKDLFLANMSHELRTPLNAIIGCAQLLQLGGVAPSSPRFSTYLGQIVTSGEELLALIETVLNYVEIQSGKLAFDPKPLRLPDVVDGVVEMFGDEARRKSISLSTDIDPSIGELRLDEMRLMQVVAHYLANALKFSRPGGHVRVRARAEGEAAFRLEVEDDGIGIAADDLPRLFIAFQQLSQGSTRRYPGAGMGLAITRRLVEAQGGSVGVKSEEGAGSTFHAVLPRTPPAA
jgi:PAS domain S-box-containing protein